MSRRPALLLVFAAVLPALLSPPARTGAPADPRPNVVLILADDLGTLDLRCYGSEDLHTPHLDRLARDGLRFTQFYVDAPVCSPSRAALLTGRSHMRAGVPGNVASDAGKPGMPASEVTLAEVLKAAGYRTALFGKWHLGTIPECEPPGQGFDEFFGHKGGCIDNYSHFFYWAGPHFHDLWRGDREVWEDGEHFTSLLVRETRRFVRANRTRPFFLFLALNVPHYPKQPRPPHLQRHRSLPEPRRSYAAAVADMDAAVGEVVRSLRESGLAERTMVIFQSDHGHSTEERTGFGGGNAGPFRGAKFSLLEGGIRVPCVVTWPGRLPRGESRGQFAVSVDWLPTLAGLCGAEIPRRPLDGRDLSAVLRSAEAPSPHERYHWMQEQQLAVREGEWKLVINGRDTSEREKRLPPLDPVFLTNLRDDPGERRNRAAQEPERVRRMTESHRRWAAGLRTGAVPPRE